MRPSDGATLKAQQPIAPDSDAAIAVRPGEQAEIELKLLAPQGVLEKLSEMPVIAQHARNRGVVRRLETVYYDTLERALFQRGMSLRVRRSGKHFIQTLKLVPDIGRPLARRQWETPVDSIIPDLARLPATEIGDPVTTLACDALVPVFATKVRRHARQLDLPDASVEIVFDEGTIEAGTRQEVLSEIELESTPRRCRSVHGARRNAAMRWRSTSCSRRRKPDRSASLPSTRLTTSLRSWWVPAGIIF